MAIYNAANHTSLYLRQKVLALKRIKRNPYTCATKEKYLDVQKQIEDIEQIINERELLKLIGG